MTHPVALALEAISKRFGTTQALSTASLTIRRGTVHALLGENGAGKTTLMRIAYGLVQPDAGAIRGSDGHRVKLDTPAAAIRAGIGMVHQHFTTIDAMTVAENVAFGGSGRFDRRATDARVREIAATLGVTIDPNALGSTLGVPAHQHLEIIKALSRKARILILDEPTAVLAPVEIEQLMGRIRSLAAAGLSIVLITHKLREALAVADDVTVLRQGSTVLAAPASTLGEHELASAMVGTGWSSPGIASRPEFRRTETATESLGDVDPLFRLGGDADTDTLLPHRDVQLSGPVVRARGISVLDAQGAVRVRDVDLDIHGGEIVGIAGVEGSGIHELLHALAGRARISAGSLEVPPVVAFTPENRHHDAIALDFTLTENVALRGAGSRRGFSRWRTLRDRTRSLMSDFDVRAPGPETTMRNLSGGNQQKLVLARELEGTPRLIVAQNPTRGLDLRATASIHGRLRAARDAGLAVVVYSSDLDELLSLSDRTYAMFAGSLIATARERQVIGQAMLGVATPI